MAKLFKIILMTFFVIIAFSAANIIKINETDQIVMGKYNQPSVGSTQIFFPRGLVTDKNASEIVSLVEGVSKDTDTPFTFRTALIQPTNNQQGSINWLKETQHTFIFFQTNYSSENQMIYHSGGVETIFENQSLNNISYEQLYNADTFIPSSDQTKLLNRLASVLNTKYLLSLKAADLTKAPDAYAPLQFEWHSSDEITFFIQIAFVFYLIFLFVWLVEKNQTIAILRLNGLSAFKIAARLFVGNFLIVTLLSVVISSLFILRKLDTSYLLLMLELFVAIIACSYLAILLVSRRSLVNQINNRSFLKHSHYFLTFMKVVVFVLSIGATVNVVTLINKTSNLGNDPKLSGYATLYPGVFGYTLNYVDRPSYTNLFKYAEKDGALHASVYSPPDISLAGLSDIQVNDNYLKKYPLVSADGKRVQIDSNTSQGLVLIPEKLKSRLTEIKNAYIKSNSSGLNFKSQNISYVLIKDNQKIPIFDDKGSKISPDLIEVYTVNNASEIFPSQIIVTMGNSMGLLFPIKGSIAATYKDIIPSLKADHILESYPSLIPANTVPAVNVLLTMGYPPSYIFSNIFPFFLFLGLIFAAVSFYFKVKSREFMIQRLQGFSYLRSYWKLFLMVACQYVFSFFFLIWRGASPEILELLAIYLVIELVITLTMLYRLEKYSLLDTLKGE